MYILTTPSVKIEQISLLCPFYVNKAIVTLWVKFPLKLPPRLKWTVASARGIFIVQTSLSGCDEYYETQNSKVLSLNCLHICTIHVMSVRSSDFFFIYLELCTVYFPSFLVSPYECI